jgi:hypothetical protein
LEAGWPGRRNSETSKGNMKRVLKPAVLAAVTAVMVWLPVQGWAQGGGGGGGGGGGRGNFNPEEMRQRMMDNYRETLGVKGDDEWKVVESRITKVMEARRDVGVGGMGFGMRGMMGRRGGQGGDNANANASTDQNQRRQRNFMGGQQSAAAQALQQAVESNASSDTIKAKLTAYRDEVKDKQTKLEQARADLKKVLSVKQEAHAVLAGLLD